ncbi:MAG TPA: GPW/gp25 family protein [Gaiellaceae bacterium]|jgi:phage baseplate assembly protein W|nr:GPW/gp25 family protein [Gaiellaceae bacterium]
MSFVPRSDYAYPLRIDGGSQQAAQSPYAAHVEQMIEQILLTTPGERVDLPDFGCGLRRLVFAPMQAALDATLKLQVTQALQKWLAGVIQVGTVDVQTSADDAALAEGTVQVTVTYTLIDTQTAAQTRVLLP